jgi:pimeloyl-ACP methyl ester carboxylesterase
MSASRPGGTRFAVRNNSRIAYDPGSASGPGLSADTSTVVLLHDLLADRNALATLRTALGAVHRVISPDARGHGASATLANQWYTVAELAQDVLAIMDLEGVATAHVVGHGLGGAMAFELARRFGNRVATLTMIEPALYGILDNDSEPAAAGLRNELRATDRAAADAAYKGLVDKSLDTYLLPRWGSEWRASTSKPRLGAIRRHAAALSGLLPALDAYTIAKNELRQILVPTLIVTGDDANPIDRLTAARLAALLPVARVEAVSFGPRPNSPLSGDSAAPLNALIAGFIAET